MSAGGVAWRGGSRETFMEIDIDEKKIKCLLNTGYDHSLVPRCLIPDVPVHSGNINVFAINGTKIDVLHCVRLSFTIDGQVSFSSLLVSNNISEFMLGIGLPH